MKREIRGRHKSPVHFKEKAVTIPFPYILNITTNLSNEINNSLRAHFYVQL